MADIASTWAAGHFDDGDGVLIVDETADEKSSTDAAGAARQYSGTVGDIALCQVAATALVGLIFLGSCVLAGKPLVFYMAQRYGTDGSRDGMATFEMMWAAYRGFRTAMYVISY